MSAFERIGLEGIDDVSIIRQRELHTVYRVYTTTGTFIVKCFLSSPPVKEIQVYSLLQENGIRTLPLYGSTENAIILEDLDSSTMWRCAGEEDLFLPSTGQAVSSWYRKLHAVGLEIVNTRDDDLSYLQPWIEIIDQDSLESTAKTLGMAGSDAWKMAMDHHEDLKTRYRAFPQTFNYTDFASVNIALSKGTNKDVQAIVFDYDQFSIGTTFSDWRNVTYSLKGEAREAFIHDYGDISDDEKRVDDALSILEGLIIASSREFFPMWAEPLRDSVTSGELEKKISAALEIL